MKSNIGVSALKKMFDSGQLKVKRNPEKSKSTAISSKNDISCIYGRDGQPNHKTGNMLILGKFILHKSKWVQLKEKIILLCFQLGMETTNKFKSTESIKHMRFREKEIYKDIVKDRRKQFEH